MFKEKQSKEISKLAENETWIQNLEELKQIKARVRALSPQATLDRGYSVVQLADGQIVTDPKKLKQGDLLRLRLAKGETQATATGQ